MATESASARLNLITAPFKLKGSFLSALLLQPHTTQLAQLRQGLEQRMQQGAALLKTAPLVLVVEDPQQSPPLAELYALCREMQLHPVAVRSSDAQVQQQARVLGLMALNSLDNQTPAANQVDHAGSLLHQGTVRGGQQLINEQGDLIILGSVNPGAEVLASGHIHVYGSLRGRALAGIYGDTQARVFAQQLDAELVAIAGRYRTSQQSDLLKASQASVISLQADQLVSQIVH